MRVFTAIFLLLNTVHSFGQWPVWDARRNFISEAGYGYHSQIMDVLDNNRSNGYSKIDFIGESRFLFMKIQSIMSFTFINDSVVKLNEVWTGSHPYERNEFYLRMNGTYNLCDSAGKALYLYTQRETITDSAGYTIIEEEHDTLMASNSRSVYSSDKNLIEHFRQQTNYSSTQKYSYSGDTIYCREFAQSRLVNTKKIVSSKIQRKRKVITRHDVTSNEFLYPQAKLAYTEYYRNTKKDFYNKKGVLIKIKMKGGEISGWKKIKIKYHKK